MTDRVGLVRAEIKWLRKEVKDNIAELGNSESERIGLFKDLEIYDNILSFIDSMEDSPCLKCPGDESPGTCASISELGRCALKYQKEEPVSEDLEEALEYKVKAIFDSLEKFDVNDKEKNRVAFGLIELEAYAKMFYNIGKQAGANWQKQQDNNDANHALVEQTKTQQMCYEKGMADMKQQMMKEAISCPVTKRDVGISLSITNRDVIKDTKDLSYLKVIIIKED